MKLFLQSITTRIAIWMIVIASVPLLVIAYTLLYQKKDEITAQHLSNLQVVFNQTIDKIETNLQYQQQLLKNIAAKQRIAEKLLSTNPNETMQLDPVIENYVTNVVKENGYYDFFILSETGVVVYSYKKEGDYGKSINDLSMKKTALAKVCFQVLATRSSAVSPLEYYSHSKRKSSFIATPILKNQKVVGVIAVQLNDNHIFDLLKHYNGLGKTGEVVAGALTPDGKVVAAMPLKYDADAYKNERVLNAGHNATGMVQAVRGKGGRGEIVDYRGVPSLAVWGYEPILKWGIVVKTDKNEVLNTFYKDEEQLLYILIFIIIALIGTIFMSAKRITRPINNLIMSMRQFRKEGVFNLNVAECEGELCYLSQEFLTMAEEIKAHHHNLEEKIHQRTNELRLAKSSIENYVGIVDRFVITSSTDLNGKITYASKAFEEISGYSNEELIGKNHRILRDPQMPNELFENLWETITSGKDWHGEIRNIAKDGSYYWVSVHISPNFDAQGKMIGYTAIRQNITDKKMIEEISLKDQLTGLYNRRHLDAVLEKNCQMAERYNIPFSVAIIDIDHFKNVNDTYGHQVGDYVLQNLSEILKSQCRAVDILGRWGGEEFLIIFPNTEESEAEIAAEKIRKAIEIFPMEYVGNKTASIGVCEYHDNLNETIKRADEALYQAKAQGRNRVCTYRYNKQ
ncbi:MAG: diguanylate cyclase [Sulfuricurvum sp.]|uniref:sensor domain-containing diguanylate cyclase n=1 Tax=Sulfuricurvum sp. TaxID=2025608 RepID=UPI002733EB4A|nr:diguanylate cyclase [Sulfuricurvum sp.]MDP2850829.1 diguanylate cyclase [Sulfuricurvum sp.]